jgi:sigma-B regulation protein RsbU (phosphoserine phosphatase)
MQDPTTIALILCVVCLVISLLALKKQRDRAKRAKRQLQELTGEEERMFHFLHDLGESIVNDPSAGQLSRLIVEGIDKVVAARGGAIYQIGSEPDYLYPAYVSDECPPLIVVPEELTELEARDPKALSSYLRLSRTDHASGLLGHCFTTGENLHIADVAGHEGMAGAGGRAKTAVLLSPLRHAGKIFGVIAVARHEEDGPFTENDFAVFRSIAEQSSFAIGNARIHREAHEKRAIEGELHNAREVQRVLLPESEPIVPGFRISGVNLPARLISGDYYDYLELAEQRFGIAIADVSGKGVPAGLLMAMCRSSLRATATELASPSAALARVNRLLFPDIREDMFISMIYAVLEPPSGLVRLARAGHDAALWYHHATGTVDEVRSPGLALGIDGGQVFSRVTKDVEFTLEPGDCLLLHTDGVREAIGPDEEEFGIERMIEVFRVAAPIGSEEVISRMQLELRAFMGDGIQMDDVTLVAIEKKR